MAQKSGLLTLNDVSYDETERNFWNDEHCSQLRRYLSSLYTSRNACNKVFETVFNQGGLVEVCICCDLNSKEWSMSNHSH